MTTSAAQADAFYREVLARGEVWTIRDAGGIPAPEVDGHRAMPFWSAESRAGRIIARAEAYRGFEAVAVDLAEWRSRWLPGLQKDGLQVGLNWSSERATGYDVDPDEVERTLSARSTPPVRVP